MVIDPTFSPLQATFEVVVAGIPAKLNIVNITVSVSAGHDPFPVVVKNKVAKPLVVSAKFGV